MTSLIKVFLLIILFKLIQSSSPSAYDINKIKNAVLRIKDHPTLCDYGQDTTENDLACYNSGIDNEDAHLSIEELVEKYGYNFEKHTVKSEDGYFLSLHRIPGKGPVVFLNHGVLGSSVDWIMAGEDSLPYLLAEKGYDVWLGNARGNTYSRKHEKLSPKSAEFWDFSWDEMGYYDLPASIDYILSLTDEEKLTYIGYSQGTTVLFVMCSLLPDYNDKISSAIAMSPMAWVTHMTSPLLRVLSQHPNAEYGLLKLLGVNEFAPSSVLTRAVAGVICEDNPIAKVVCSSASALICGIDHGQLNMDYLYTIYQHFPAGSATKQLLHYAQGIKSGDFKRFDYDMSKNIEKYGSISAPHYPVGNIRVNISLFYSNSDWLSNVKDVMKLKEELGNVRNIVYVEGYNHLDYLWAANVKENVYDKVLDFIE